MALNIKNEAVEERVRELARRRGQGITEMLDELTRRELEREKRKPQRKGSYEEFSHRIEAIVDRVNRLPVLDDRSPDEIIGYNEHGLFD